MDQALRDLLTRLGVITAAQIEREEEYYQLTQTLKHGSEAARLRAENRIAEMGAEDRAREQSSR